MNLNSFWYLQTDQELLPACYEGYKLVYICFYQISRSGQLSNLSSQYSIVTSFWLDRLIQVQQSRSIKNFALTNGFLRCDFLSKPSHVENTSGVHVWNRWTSMRNYCSTQIRIHYPPIPRPCGNALTNSCSTSALWNHFWSSISPTSLKFANEEPLAESLARGHEHRPQPTSIPALPFLATKRIHAKHDNQHLPILGQAGSIFAPWTRLLSRETYIPQTPNSNTCASL